VTLEQAATHPEQLQSFGPQRTCSYFPLIGISFRNDSINRTPFQEGRRLSRLRVPQEIEIEETSLKENRADHFDY